MEVLRLPATLRRSLIPHLPSLHRYLISTTSPEAFDTDPYPPPPATPPTLSSYISGPPPRPERLKFASAHFTASPPCILYTTSTFRLLPPSPIPELAVLGRSNVGKSSLLNALFNTPKTRPAHVSKRPGRTRTINGFGVAGALEWGAAPQTGERHARWKRFPRGGVVVVDMPGYGAGSREAWGGEVMKFLERRKQLRRCFVLVDAEHGLKASDVQLLTHLRRNGLGFSIILSKVDKVLYAGSRAPGPERLANKAVVLREMCDDIRAKLDAEAADGRKGAVDIFCCSAEKTLEKGGGSKRIGIDEVRWAALSACGIECDEFGRRKGFGDVLIQEDEIEEDERGLM